MIIAHKTRIPSCKQKTPGKNLMWIPFFSNPWGGLEESEIRAELGKGGELLRRLIVSWAMKKGPLAIDRFFWGWNPTQLCGDYKKPWNKDPY